MINIRSLTVGINWEDQSKSSLEKNISDFISLSKKIFEQDGVSVRTTRLSLSPLNSYEKITQAGGRSLVSRVSDLCQNIGIRWFCVPFNFLETNNKIDQVAMATDIIRRFPNAFVNLIVANKGEINHEGVRSASQLIRIVSQMSDNGFDNFRVGVACGCKPHTPFFSFFLP